MFRQRLKGGHRVGSQTKQDGNQHILKQNQSGWSTSPVVQERSPGPWEGEAVDSSWNWDVNNGNSNANVPSTTIPNYQQASMSQSPCARDFIPPVNNHLGANDQGSYNQDMQINSPNVAPVNYSLQAKGNESNLQPTNLHQTGNMLGNEHSLNSLNPSTEDPAVEFHKLQENSAFLGPKNTTQTQLLQRSKVSLNGNPQETEGWNDWETWDDWNNQNEGAQSNNSHSSQNVNTTTSLTEPHSTSSQMMLQHQQSDITVTTSNYVYAHPNNDEAQFVSRNNLELRDSGNTVTVQQNAPQIDSYGSVLHSYDAIQEQDNSHGGENFIGFQSLEKDVVEDNLLSRFPVNYVEEQSLLDTPNISMQYSESVETIEKYPTDFNIEESKAVEWGWVGDNWEGDSSSKTCVEGNLLSSKINFDSEMLEHGSGGSELDHHRLDVLGSSEGAGASAIIEEVATVGSDRSNSPTYEYDNTLEDYISHGTEGQNELFSSDINDLPTNSQFPTVILPSSVQFDANPTSVPSMEDQFSNLSLLPSSQPCDNEVELDEKWERDQMVTQLHETEPSIENIASHSPVENQPGMVITPDLMSSENIGSFSESTNDEERTSISTSNSQPSSHPPSPYLVSNITSEPSVQQVASFVPDSSLGNNDHPYRQQDDEQPSESVPNVTKIISFSPSGVVPDLRARKGSLFQPPVPRKSSFEESNINAPPKSTAGAFWSMSNNPDLPVMLSVAAREPDKLKTDSLNESITANAIPLIIPGMVKEEVERDNSPISGDPPVAHASNKKPELVAPKVLSLAAAQLANSPGILDLSKPLPKESRQPIKVMADPPSFSRMVPGESSKSESSSQNTYQTPTAVPAMPSGRVVTGNDHPQPVAIARIKQEPNEVRSPPDGPDTEPLLDPISSVVPPIRSETIGSEEPATRMFPPLNDSRTDKSGDSRRERVSWDRDAPHGNDYYLDRHTRDRDYYGRESPHSKKSYDRDYDNRYSDLQRRLESGDDDDERRYNNDPRGGRRHRAYREELERYEREEVDKGRYVGRSKRKNFDSDRHVRNRQEDDDHIFYDRSQPTSQSSSFTNLETDPPHNSHLSHREEYFDRSHRYRDQRYEDFPRERRHTRREPRDQRDPYMRGYPPYGDHYGSREMYDPQSYYYYYQKYLEQHPYYREYYRQYYRGYGYNTGDGLADDKASTRSGRSSINDELKKSSLSSGDISGVPSITDDGLNNVPQRMTPPVFSGIHCAVSFTSSGKLLKVLPHDPKEGEKPIVQVLDLQQILCNDKEYARRIENMKTFPGPLAVGDTHKDIVIQFCEKKATDAAQDPSLPDRESVILLWDYLALLVKQNGKVCGADLAALLLKGKVASSEKSTTTTTADGQSSDSKSDVVEALTSSLSTSKDQSLLIRQFTDFLCIGRKKEAIDFAVKEGLWGYAMTLAAKMDSVTHARVTTAFVNSIPPSDVLLTLLQHLSGKRPDVTKVYSADRWGDWRQHLATMVSNPTGQLQRDQLSIIALGDTLASKGLLHAAHLCYIAGDAQWGSFSQKESKLVLLGSSHHHQNFQAFASEDALHCTEIYEYAKSLDVNNPTMSSFQHYKLIYALRLAECGFPTEALKYCELISSFISKNMNFNAEFVSKVYDLACRLKYHDVHYQIGEGEVADMSDPEWLQLLYQTLYTIQYYASQQHSEGTIETKSEPPVNVQEVPSCKEELVDDVNVTGPEYDSSNHVQQTDYVSRANGVSEDFPPERQTQEIPMMINAELNSPPSAYNNSLPEVYNSLPETMPAANSMMDHVTQPNSMEMNNSDGFNNQNSSPYGGGGYYQTDQQPQAWHQPQREFQPQQQGFSSLPPYTHDADSVDNYNRDFYPQTPQASISEQHAKEEAPVKSKEPQKEKEEVKDDKDKKPGLISRLFGWREEKQAKLPDDKNPTIVWDEDKNRWVNKDGDESEDSTPPPPPVISAVPPNPASFRGQKKSRYVDPVGEKDRAKGLPMMPSMRSVTPPGPNQRRGVPATDGPNPMWGPQQHQQQQQQFDVAQHPQGDDDGGGEPIPMMGAPGGANAQPVFYNPGRFQAAAPNAVSAAPAAPAAPNRSGPIRRANMNPNPR